MELIGVPVEYLVAAAVLLISAAFILSRRRSSSSSAPATSASKAAPKVNLHPRGKLLILWGSQTGTAEGLGSTLMREARQRGYAAKSVDLEDYEVDDLADEEGPVIFLMATHGEGEPTDNAVAFYNHLKETEGEEICPYPDVKFTVFGLGNTQYQQYNSMGKFFDQRLASLGAERIFEMGLGDDDGDLEEDFDTWKTSLWEKLCPDDDGLLGAPAANFEADFTSERAKSAPPPLVGGLPMSWLQKLFPKQPLFACALRTVRELTSDATQGSVLHMELECGGGAKPGAIRSQLRYEGADDLAVLCDNGAALAAKTAGLLQLNPAQRFLLKTVPGSGGMPPPLPTPCSVGDALRYYVDVRAPAGRQLLLVLAENTSSPGEAERLRHLASKEGKAEYATWVVRDGRGLVDILEAFPSAAPPFGLLLELVPKLAVRYYTISSSPRLDKTSVHLTVKILREPMHNAVGRTKEGVCTTFLETLSPGGDSSAVFVRASTFRLPADGKTPVIMVGPGTGIAPFRAFLQELEVAVKAGKRRAGHTRLYFGCRKAALDFLYQEELETALKSGALTSLRTAFSREQAVKVYVQGRMREDGAELWEFFNAQRGHLYICGGTGMGRDVVAAVQEMACTHGKLDQEAAVQFTADMQTQGRLVQELWS